MIVHYTMGGKTFTHPAQDWIWDIKKKAVMPHHWVFAGSVIIKDPDNGREFYGANSGDIISISNFPYSLLEIPVEISKDDAQLSYEVKTDRLPPLGTRVDLRFQVPGVWEQLHCRGIVRSTAHADPHGGQLSGFGVEFEGLPEGAVEQLQAFIERHLVRSLLSR